MTYELKTYDGAILGTIYPLENNGPSNKSIAREIVDVIFDDTTFSPAVDSFVVAGDALHLKEGQRITVSGSGYSGPYTISDGNGATPTGSTVGVIVNNNTHIPIGTGIMLPAFQVASVTTGVGGKFGFVNAHNGKHSFLPGLTFALTGNGFVAANATYTVASAETSEVYTVTTVVTATRKITITGSVTRFFEVGTVFQLSGTTNGIGAGLYTVESTAVVGDATEITVVEVIPVGTAVNSTTRVVRKEQLTLVTVTGTVPVGTQVNGVAELQGAISRTFDAPTTIASTASPKVFTVIYHIPGDYTAMLIAGTPVMIKFASVDGATKSYVARVTSTVFISISGTYPQGLTQVVTQYTNETAVTPVIITGVSARMVFPLPAIPFGYLTYSTENTLTPFKLVGKGASQFNDTVSWGQVAHENLIQSTENFRGAVPPTAPLKGSLWYDTATPALRFKTNNTFNVVGVITGSGGTQRWSIDAVQAGLGIVGDKIVIFDNAAYPTGTKYTIASITSESTPSTSSGTTTHFVVTEAILAGASTAGGSTTAPYGKMYNMSQMHGLLVPGIASTGNVNMAGYLINNLGNPLVSGDALNLGFADARYVNVTGDSMSGALTMTSANVIMSGGDISMLTTADLIFDAAGSGTIAMNGSGGITVASGNIVLGSTATDRITFANNGTAAPTITFNTTTSSVTTGNAVIDLGSNKITNSSTPTLATDLANKQYVDDRVNGIIWISPIIDPNLFADNLSAPPAIPGGDTLIPYHRTYIVNGTGTGAWAGFNGHAMWYDPASSSWKSVLGRTVAIGDRFGVYIEPDDDDTLAVPTSGGLAGHAGKIATVTGLSPYTYSFYVPTEPDAVSVRGNATGSSPHFGHSYTFRGTHGTGSYGTNYRWIEFSGPQMLVDGAGLRYLGNILNIGAGTGITVGADSVALDTSYVNTNYVRRDGTTAMTAAFDAGTFRIINVADATAATDAVNRQFGDGRYVTKATSSVLSAAVNLTFAGGGEVLGLPATPSVGDAATSKTYVDATFVSKVASTALNSNVNLTFAGTGEVLGLPATPSVGDAATSKTYVDTNFVSKVANTTLSANIDIVLQGGGEILGLPATPSVGDAAASKTYVDAQDLANKGLVVNSQSAAYTLVLADANALIYHPPADTTARIWTIPSNASVAFPIGTRIIFDNDNGAGVITISITTDTLVLISAGTTGNRTLASGGQATAVKVSATRWRIFGTGLT